jgi:hypothetical protein
MVACQPADNQNKVTYCVDPITFCRRAYSSVMPASLMILVHIIVLALNKAAERLRRHGLRLCQLRRHFRRVAREYGSFADLISSNDCMRKDGVEPAFCLDHGLTISLYYRDPEGNFVELQSDNFSDWKLSGEFMRTSPDFAANPIGTFFDPAKVHDAFKAGTAFKTLQQTIRAGAYLPNPIPNIGLPA